MHLPKRISQKLTIIMFLSPATVKAFRLPNGRKNAKGGCCFGRPSQHKQRKSFLAQETVFYKGLRV